MPRIYTICSHPDRDAIDEAIVSQAPNRQVASLHSVSEGSVRRHAANHLPKTLVRASEIQAVASADELLSQPQRLQEEALGVLEFAKSDGNPGGVLQAIDRLQKGLALLARLKERVPEGDEPRTFADLVRRAEEEEAVSVRWQDCPHHPEGCPMDA